MKVSVMAQTARRPFWSGQQFLNVAMAGICAVAVTMSILAVASTLPPHARHGLAVSDYTTYYGAGDAVAHGETSKVYDLDGQRRAQSRVLGRELRQPMGFVNPPHTLFLLRPLALLAFDRSFVLWVWGSCAALLSAAAVLVRRSRKRLALGEQTTLVLLLLASPPLWTALYQGSLVPVSVIAAAIAVQALKSGRLALASAALVLVSIKPQFAAVIVAVLLGRRMWRAAGSVVAGQLLAIVASSAVFGARVWPSYLSVLRSIDWHGSSTVAMWNVRGVAAVLLGPTNSGLVDSIGSIVFVFALGAVAVAAWRTRGSVFDGRLVWSALAVAVLTSPHTHSHDWLMLVAAIGSTWSSLTPRQRLLAFALLQGMWFGTSSASLRILIVASMAAAVAVKMLGDRAGERAVRPAN